MLSPARRPRTRTRVDLALACCCRYLTDMPVRELVNDQYLWLIRGEKEGFLTLKFRFDGLDLEATRVCIVSPPIVLPSARPRCHWQRCCFCTRGRGGPTPPPLFLSLLNYQLHTWSSHVCVS